MMPSSPMTSWNKNVAVSISASSCYRWKGHGEESDTWEAENDLNCKDMMEKFISRWEKRKEVDERELRQNPKRTAKMLFSRSLR